jgi:4-diphosphocytidyl-2-C-methyl-D-erythritol kinase
MKLLVTILTNCLLSLHLSNAWTQSSHVFIPTTSSTKLFSSAQASSETSSTVDPSQYDLSLFSPCKINLFLRIIRKREDGYHDLASLFQTIGFGDMLHLKMLTDDESDGKDIFECNMEGVPTDKTNLVIRALDLVRVKTGNEDKFFRANLVKQVPAQAGLGGGSGNAAAAMWGANQLLGNPATLEEVRMNCMNGIA